MTFNPYTNTNDFPELMDFAPLDAFNKPKNPALWTVQDKQKANSDLQAALQAWIKKYNIPQSVIDQWNASQAKGEDSNTFWQRMKANVQNAAQNVTNAVKTTVNKVSDAGTVAKTKALLILFRPLVPVAQVYLKRKGITPSDNLAQLVQQVYNERSKKGFGYSGSGLDSFDWSGQAGTGHVEMFGFGPEDISPDMVAAVIPFLTAIIEAIKGKQAANQPLTEDEKKIAGLIPDIEKQMNAAKSDAVNETETKIFGLNWKYALAILILLVLLITFRKKLA